MTKFRLSSLFVLGYVLMAGCGGGTTTNTTHNPGNESDCPNPDPRCSVENCNAFNNGCHATIWADRMLKICAPKVGPDLIPKGDAIFQSCIDGCNASCAGRFLECLAKATPTVCGGYSHKRTGQFTNDNDLSETLDQLCRGPNRHQKHVASCLDNCERQNNICGKACPGGSGVSWQTCYDCASKCMHDMLTCQDACPVEPGACNNGVQDGDETDVDCGGSCSLGCLTGMSCHTNADCVSLCSSGKCSEPTCHDGKKNGVETDVDCGWPNCPPCANELTCHGGVDCASRSCQPANGNNFVDGGMCIDGTCDNGVQDGEETDTDCGGAQCPPCTVGKHCKDRRDCVGIAAMCASDQVCHVFQ